MSIIAITMYNLERTGCILLILFGISIWELKAQTITLEPQNTTIIITDREWIVEKGTREFLQRVLRKLYGTDKGFDIYPDANVNEAKIEDKIIISIGETRYVDPNIAKGLKDYGFIIKRNRNIISIIGKHPLGSLYGMMYFMDKYCGIRYYIPGDLFISFPKQKKIIISGNIDIKEEPFTTSVMATGLNNGVEGEGLWAWLSGIQRKNWESHQHSMGDRFPAVKFAQKYPNIYPVFDGKRYFPQSAGDQQWQPDFAEPSLVDAAVESAINYFKAKPDIDYLSFSVQDSYKYSTEGKTAEVLKKYPNTAQGLSNAYTDTYVQFLNKVARRLERELPQQGISKPKTIVYLSYGYVNQIPKEKLHPNILPILVSQISELDKDGVVSQQSPVSNPLHLSEWAKVTHRIGHHDWAQGHGYFYPRIYTNLYVTYLKHLKELGLQSEYVHAEFYPNWGLDGPKYYLLAKVLWSPDIDVHGLMNQFCSDMFGRAGKEMNKYFTLLENLTYSMDNNPAIYRKIFSFPKQLLLNEQEMEMVKQARKHLDKAMRLTKNKEEKERIDLFSRSFKLTEYLFEAANSKDISNAKIDEIKNYVEAKIATDKRTLYSARNKGEITGWVNTALKNIVESKK